MTPVQILDEVLEAISPTLTAAGYRRTARNFVAVAGGVARILQFQTSQLKKADEASFTLNVLVSSSAFHEAYTGKPFPRNVATAEPVVQGGIGRLMPDGEPIWWSLSPEVSPALVARELEGLLKDKVLPFLARFPDEAALLKELGHGEALPGFSAMRERCRAVLLARRGQKAAAAGVLSALIDANPGADLQGFRDSVHALAERLSVPLR